MRGYMTISNEDKNNILKQHSTFYNGYATGNIPSNMQPLRQDNGPKDTMGINVNSRGEVSTYKNHLVNEQIDFPPKFGDEREDYSSLMDDENESIDFPPEFGDEEQDYESLMDTDTESIDFPPEFGDEEEDYSYSEDSYGMDVESIMSMFDGSIDSDFEYDDEMDIDLYEEEQCEGCGSEMYEESEMCEQCGGEMKEGECMECGSMYEEMDSDLKESFLKEKQRISEMFDRFKKFN
jgi:hypothetical protein